MSRHLPSLNGLRAFEAAGRHRSFTAAGQELNVTQAAVSRMVRLLEERLGFALFRRHANALELTIQGQAFLSGLTDLFEFDCSADRTSSCNAGGSRAHGRRRADLGGELADTALVQASTAAIPTLRSAWRRAGRCARCAMIGRVQYAATPPRGRATSPNSRWRALACRYAPPNWRQACASRQICETQP